ncbi:glutathione synthetase-like isoform X2 [Uloborus diversus]|nr:glutathione synthetase-like isoform X2 [Uloborus diversus]
MRPRNLSHDTRVPLPFCLVPSKFPSRWFYLARELQPYLNQVLLDIAHSRDVLKECLSSTIEVDEFTSNIYKIFEAVDRLDRTEQSSLGLLRSDYLLNMDDSGNVIGLKQVENNAIAASFGGLAPSVRHLHEFVLEKLGQKAFHHLLPENESDYELARGLIAAWDVYDNPSSIILFVVEEVTYNICDQRALEYAILDTEKDVEILRCTFKDLRTSAILRDEKLFVHGKEVAVVYYRTGYVPEDYEPIDWETRFLMEKSRAIKCPSAGLHLACSKRVQAFLTREGILERFLPQDIADHVRQVFAKQYSLEMTENGDRAIKLGLENPDKYVLKPERDGGGNNLYGEDVKTTLDRIKSTEERMAYILMERINPPAISNCIVLGDCSPEIGGIVCELGAFGIILGSKKKIFKNNYGGHLLRSKRIDSNETGVAAGFGALDSPYLE